MLRQILDSCIHRNQTTSQRLGVTPGGVLVYGDDGNDVETIAFGASHSTPPEGVFEVTADTIYDIASVTKPVATAAVLMQLDVDLDEPVAPLVPELRVAGSERITWAHLLGHASGFPAHLKFYERLLAGQRAGAHTARDALLRMVCGNQLDREPGQQTVYSDLGYILLGFAIERLTGRRLDVCMRELVTEPLGMSDTFFVDLEASDTSDAGAPGDPQPIQSRLARVAPTEICPYRGLVRGAVHDDNCHAGGGVHGHAGVFATAGDLARFARAMVRAAAGLQHPGGFDPERVRGFVTRSSAPNTTWRLGWDRPSPPPAVSHAGTLWPREGIGHLGFTGSSMWLDPSRGRYVILLTNRVHPGRDPAPGQQSIRELRASVMDAVVQTLGPG